MDLFKIIAISCLLAYIFVGLLGGIHVFTMRIEYHDKYKALVSSGFVKNKYPSGISWFDSQNHWQAKLYKQEEHSDLKKLGDLLSEIFPFFPPPQNLFFTVAYLKWLKKNWGQFDIKS
ncbi:hypothetical protein ACOI22_11390 [Glaciecola sp. 2405UD65-10]|uniref:hypothetical protein n=1 Tax=Glaciecola sp. 2405UD65-10 TaxID=3397244 RepID=UPI003B5C9C27